MCIYRCIVIFLQVDYYLLKPQKRFELNWFNVAITTTGRLDLRWLPTISWKVVKMQIYLHSQIVPLDILEDKNYRQKPIKRARGCCVHIFLVSMHSEKHTEHIHDQDNCQPHCCLSQLLPKSTNRVREQLDQRQSWRKERTRL